MVEAPKPYVSPTGKTYETGGADDLMSALRKPTPESAMNVKKQIDEAWNSGKLRYPSFKSDKPGSGVFFDKPEDQKLANEIAKTGGFSSYEDYVLFNREFNSPFK